MREKPGCQDLQKHLKEGRRDCCNLDMEEERDEREGRQKREDKEWRSLKRPDWRETRLLESR